VYNIAGWNANGLTQRIKEVEVFLNTQKIDIFLVSETHFTERNYVNIPYYITYATSHLDGRAHAGSAIIIKTDMKHHELAKYEKEHIPATNISIKDWDGNRDHLSHLLPPRHAIKKEYYSSFINSVGHRSGWR
jgi:exonuclease III